MEKQAKLINTVKKNARKLDRKSAEMQKYAGRYVAFNGTEMIPSNTFEEALAAGAEKFGKDSGYVVRKAGSIPTLSHLVLG